MIYRIHFGLGDVRWNWVNAKPRREERKKWNCYDECNLNSENILYVQHLCVMQ